MQVQPILFQAEHIQEPGSNQSQGKC